MSDAPKWRTVATHGQPKPEDYPIVWRSHRAVLHVEESAPTPGFYREVEWAPIALPEGDEPPPLPKPFKPMIDLLHSRDERPIFVLWDNGNVACWDGWDGYDVETCHAQGRIGWCEVAEWPYAPSGGAS